MKKYKVIADISEFKDRYEAGKTSYFEVYEHRQLLTFYIYANSLTHARNKAIKHLEQNEIINQYMIADLEVMEAIIKCE